MPQAAPGSVERPPDGLEGERRFSEEQLEELRTWITQDLEDAISARTQQDILWTELLRMYEGVPRKPVRDVPIPNAPNLEVPLGAIASDAIYAQALDTMFQISPVVTARPLDQRFVRHAKALQRFIDWGINNEWDLRQSVAHALLDNTQLGTGVYYVPWIEKRRKTPLGERVTRNAPVIRTVPVEDFFVPGSSPQSVHDARWVAVRHWLTKPELAQRARALGWDIEGVTTTAARDYVRNRREMFARTKDTGEADRQLFEIFDAYIHFDVDDDGISEDLLVTFDRTSRTVLRVVPNPFDRSRPFEVMQYQPRPHLFYGQGVVELLRPFQDEASEIHNQRVLNMMLANCRLWVGKEGRINESMDVWPSKVVLTDDPKSDFIGLAMADVYPSSERAEALVNAYGERRVGLNDLQQGQPGNLGSRTPATTAISVLQAVNQRFAPAFEGMRAATAAAVRQCLYRYQERALLNDPEVDRRLRRVLGNEDAQLVLEVLRSREFDDSMSVEMTANSATINKDADRQAALQLMQTLSTYYEQVLGLAQLLAQPGVPDQILATGQKVLDAAAEALDRTIRTFDQVRDPSTFVIRSSDLGLAPPTPGQPGGEPALGPEQQEVSALMAQLFAQQQQAAQQQAVPQNGELPPEEIA